MKTIEAKILLDGKQVNCVVVDFDMNGSAIFADNAIHVDKMQFEQIGGCGALEILSHSLTDLAEKMLSLPKPKKESWQGSGKRRKPRIN